MEMTFYEAIETIKGNKWIACSEKYQEAMNLIETTVNKYQEIEKVVKNRGGKPSLAILDRIIMVVEDVN